MWAVYFLVFVLGSGDVIVSSASKAIIPALVPKDQFEKANARNVTVETIGRQFAGPPLGSALFAFALPLPFWFNAITHDCPCGLPGPVLEFAGRSDGLVKIMGRRCTVTALHEALEPFGVSIPQVVITSTGTTEQLIVRVEAGHDLSPADIDAHLRATFAPFAERTDFDAGLDVFSFTVETYADGELDRDPVSGKVRPVLDQRI